MGKGSQMGRGKIIFHLINVILPVHHNRFVFSHDQCPRSNDFSEITTEAGRCADDVKKQLFSRLVRSPQKKNAEMSRI